MMSESIRSRVNFTRLYGRFSHTDHVWIMRVFANPCIPICRQWPCANTPICRSSSTAWWPALTLPISAFGRPA